MRNGSIGRRRGWLLAALLLGCVDVEGESGAADGAEAKDDDVVFVYPAACQDIVDACHEVDTGEGPIHDCHEAAHDVATAAACEPIRDECVALCHAAVEEDADAGDEDDAATDAEPEADAVVADEAADTAGDADATTHSHDHDAGD